VESERSNVKRIISVGMTVACLATSVFSWIPDDIVGGGYFEDEEKFPDEKVNRLQQEFKDAERLKEYFEGLFMTLGFMSEVPPRFRQKFGVPEEIMQTALMNIIRESSEKVGWESLKKDDSDDVAEAKFLLITAVGWLSACADAETKRFLMGIAVDGTKGSWHRTNAIRAYLRRADTQETRDGLVAFLVDKRLDVSSAYWHAFEVYDEIKDDTQKREAIVSALSVALAQESDRGLFADTDKKLAERSKGYAKSPQYKAALEMAGQLEEPPVSKNILWLAVLAFAFTAGAVAWWRRKWK